MNDLDRFRSIYITECFELLAEMESLLLELDIDAAEPEQLNAIFRCAHSIKGGSGAFGLTEIMQFTHVLEALLDAMREGRVAPCRDAVDTLLQSVDIVTRMVQAAQENESPPAGLGADILERLQAFCGKKTAVETSRAAPHAEGEMRAYTIAFTPHPSLFATGNEPLLLLRELGRLGEMRLKVHTGGLPSLARMDPEQCYLSWRIELRTKKSPSAIREVFEFVEDACELSIEEIASAATKQERKETIAAPAEETPVSKAPATTSIRVDVEKVDRLVNMVGELVITEAMLRSQLRDLPVDRYAELLRGVDELSHHMRELQEVVMSVRMQPVKSIFSRMPRIVRDISGQLGKDIRLVTSGEATEVDKTVIEQLGDPLTHMIRNSVDHGIETPEVRLAAGKPAQGTIHLSADNRGGMILLEIRDDGAGINRPKVLAKAVEKGLVQGDGSQLTPEEIDHLIFLPGFSTAEKVSNISGRGVGMDVVKRNIESLGGTVRIVNQPGQGSAFVVALPLTLAILDGMIVRVGAENYIIPITSILETLRPGADEVRRVEGRSDVINVRGEFMPVVYLWRIFGVAEAEKDAGRALVVLVETRHGRMGIVVDELIGQQQVVIKSLSANADPVKGVSGATILGDGRVSLILEVNDIHTFCQERKPAPLLEAA
ncbi:MAG: chemotaxis protein CheA [Alphaproteobacteria bacterium]|nr:chemotaxis protein CheA [Alphaproteobacteria bacterium]